MKTYSDLEKQQLTKQLLDGVTSSPKGFLQVTIKKPENRYLIDFIEAVAPIETSELSLATKVNWILNNRTDFPCCKTCGKKFEGRNVGALANYPTYCSTKCEKLDEDNIAKCKETFARHFSTDEAKSELKSRRRRTCLERHGSETYRNAEKNKETKLKRYGDADYNNRDKAKETCMEKYGVDNPTYLESSKRKSKQTKLRKYGDEHYVNREKAERTCLKKYGTTSPLSNEVCREKGKKTCLEKYGKESFMQTQQGIDMVAKTKLAKYGSSSFNNPEKNRETCMARYGVEHAMQLKQFRDKCRSKYFFDDRYFDSSWEVAYYIWLTDNQVEFEYHPNVFFNYLIPGSDKVHKYFPDFLVNGVLIEIKGDDQLKNGTMIDKLDQQKNFIAQAKYECMLQHGITILTGKDIKPYLQYVSQKYGRDYLSKFKTTSLKKGL